MHPDWQTELLKYCEANSSPEPEYLGDLVRYTWLHTVNPRQLSGHLQGRMLALLSRMARATCILEIGTFTGYSALCLAEGLAPGGILHTIEADEEMAWKAEQFIEGTPFRDRIVIHRGRALEILPGLEIQPELIFADAGKQEYRAYCEACFPILQPGGLMIFDNTLWSGRVLNKEDVLADPDTAKMHAFNEYVKNLEHAEILMLPLRDGLTLIRKKL